MSGELANLTRSLGKRLSISAGALFEDILKIMPTLYKSWDLAYSNNRIQQMLLARHYTAIRSGELPLPSFHDVEFRAYSQNGEDGILLYIFALLGSTNRKAVEICAGSGIECNTANLIINHGWFGLLVDGDPLNIARGKDFYRRCRSTFEWPPAFAQAWVTAENVNSLVRSNGFEGEIDLLSIDVDGNDYWLWKALDAVNPRVVVVEFNPVWGATRAVTIPYAAGFRVTSTPHGANYFGASLPALVKLARQRNYRLVGAQDYGFNAFFVRNDLGTNLLAEVSAEACLTHPRVRFGMNQRLPSVEKMEWVEV